MKYLNITIAIIFFTSGCNDNNSDFRDYSMVHECHPIFLYENEGIYFGITEEDFKEIRSDLYRSELVEGGSYDLFFERRGLIQMDNKQLNVVSENFYFTKRKSFSTYRLKGYDIHIKENHLIIDSIIGNYPLELTEEISGRLFTYYNDSCRTSYRLDRTNDSTLYISIVYHPDNFIVR